MLLSIIQPCFLSTLNRLYFLCFSLLSLLLFLLSFLTPLTLTLCFISFWCCSSPHPCFQDFALTFAVPPSCHGPYTHRTSSILYSSRASLRPLTAIQNAQPGHRRRSLHLSPAPGVCVLDLSVRWCVQGAYAFCLCPLHSSSLTPPCRPLITPGPTLVHRHRAAHAQSRRALLRPVPKQSQTKNSGRTLWGPLPRHDQPFADASWSAARAPRGPCQLRRWPLSA